MTTESVDSKFEKSSDDAIVRGEQFANCQTAETELKITKRSDEHTGENVHAKTGKDQESFKENVMKTEPDEQKNEQNTRICRYGTAGSVQGKENSTKICDFCQSHSRYMCENCGFYYCEYCVVQLHPAVGPFKMHILVQNSTLKGEDIERCFVHGLVAKLFCNTCKEKRCIECASSKCFLHFSVGVTDTQYIKEKQYLLAELERASGVLNSLGKYNQQAEEELECIQTKAILKKELIRQEFISCYDLLVEKEATLLQELDKEVEARQSFVCRRLDNFRCLEIEDVKLTSSVTELVQTNEGKDIIKDAISIQDSCNTFLSQAEELKSSWKKSYQSDSDVSLLDNPFSLFFEKKQLLMKLDQITVSEPKIQFRQKTLFIKHDQEPFMLYAYLVGPVSLPPSTDTVYTVQVLSGVRKVIWTTDTRDLKLYHDHVYLRQYSQRCNNGVSCRRHMSVVLNTPQSLNFWSGWRYLLKVKLTFVHHISALTRELRHTGPTHMMICIE